MLSAYMGVALCRSCSARMHCALLQASSVRVGHAGLMVGMILGCVFFCTAVSFSVCTKLSTVEITPRVWPTASAFMAQAGGRFLQSGHHELPYTARTEPGHGGQLAQRYPSVVCSTKRSLVAVLCLMAMPDGIAHMCQEVLGRRRVAEGAHGCLRGSYPEEGGSNGGGLEGQYGGEGTQEGD
jgi:hypothetical protein